jgi:hypothetical protein
LLEWYLVELSHYGADLLVEDVQEIGFGLVVPLLEACSHFGFVQDLLLHAADL